MQTSINITSETTSGKKITKSISNINNGVGNTALTTAASLFTAISNTTYNDADRIIKMQLTEPYEPTVKTEPILTISTTGSITYNGDGQLFIKGNNAQDNNYYQIYNNQISAMLETGYPATSYTCIVYASEGTEYTAKSATFTK